MLPEEVRFKTKTLLTMMVSPLGAFLGGIVVMLIFRGWPTESAAAWVQAVGSIGAIIAAWWISNNQRKHEALLRSIQVVVESNRVETTRLESELAKSAKVFCLAQEFDFTLMRLRDAREHGQTIQPERSVTTIQDILQRLSILDGDLIESRVEMVFKLRHEIFQLLNVLESPRNYNWDLYFDLVRDQVARSVNKLVGEANISYAMAQDELLVWKQGLI